MTAPEALRDEGMAQAENAADPRVILHIDWLIRLANALGDPWSANDVRSCLPVASQGLVGARVRAAYMRGEMERVGEVKSSLASTHAKPIGVYRGVSR